MNAAPPAALHFAPRLNDRCELALAPHQLGRHPARLRRAGGALRFGIGQLEEPGGGRLRLALLLGQPLAQPARLHDRLDPVARGEVHFEQQPPGRFLRRILVDQPPRQRLPVPKARLGQVPAHLLFRRAGEQAAETGPLRFRPVFEGGASRRGELGEEGPLIAGYRVGGIAAIERGEKGIAVAVERRVETYLGTAGDDRRRAEQPPETPDQLPESVQRGGAVEIGPENVEQMLARDQPGMGAVEIDQECERLAGSEDRLGVLPRAKEPRSSKGDERQRGVSGGGRILPCGHETVG